MSKIYNFKLRATALTLTIVLAGSACAKENNVDKKQSNNSKTTTNQTFDLPYDLKKDGITGKEVIIENDEKLVTFDVVEPTKSESEEETITNPTEPNPAESDPEPEITDKKEVNTPSVTTNTMNISDEDLSIVAEFAKYAKEYGLGYEEFIAVVKAMNGELIIDSNVSDVVTNSENLIIKQNQIIDTVINKYLNNVANNVNMDIFNPAEAVYVNYESATSINDYHKVIDEFSKNPSVATKNNAIDALEDFMFQAANPEKKLLLSQVSFESNLMANFIYVIAINNNISLSDYDKEILNHEKKAPHINGYSDNQQDCDKNKVNEIIKRINY